MSSCLPTPVERRKALEKELERCLPLLVNLEVEKIFLAGSLASGTVHSMSDLDLIVIARTEERFLDRLARFHDALQPRVAMDLFVYTPEEFAELQTWSSFLEHALKTAKVLYDARSDTRSKPVAGAGTPGS